MLLHNPTFMQPMQKLRWKHVEQLQFVHNVHTLLGHCTFLCSLTSFFHFRRVSWLKAGNPGREYFSYMNTKNTIKMPLKMNEMSILHSQFFFILWQRNENLLVCERWCSLTKKSFTQVLTSSQPCNYNMFDIYRFSSTFLSSGTRSRWTFLLGHSFSSSSLAISLRWNTATCADKRLARPLGVRSGMGSFCVFTSSTSISCVICNG